MTKSLSDAQVKAFARQQSKQKWDAVVDFYRSTSSWIEAKTVADEDLLVFEDVGARRAQIAFDGLSWTRTGPEGRKLTLRHNCFGQAEHATLPDGTPLRFCYDERMRLVKILRANRPLYELGWQDSRLCWLRRADGSQVLLRRQDNGQLVAVELDRQLVALLERDTAGRLVACGDGSGALTRYRYDARGRLRAMSLADGRQIGLHYRAGKLVRVSADEGPLLQITRRGAVIGLHYGDGSRHSLRFRDGHIEAARNGSSELRQTFNSFGRIAQEALGDDQVRFAYNANGELETLDTNFSFGLRRRFVRDGDGMPRTISLGELAIGLRYDANLTLWELRFPGGIRWRSEASFVDGRRRTRITDEQEQPLLSLDEQLDRRGRVTERSSAGQIERFVYDPQGRLCALGTEPRSKSQRGGRKTLEFALDAAGNRHDLPARYSAANQLLSLAGEDYRYDAWGNLIEVRQGSKNRRFLFRSGNQLREIHDDGQPIARYRYDALGRRLAKDTPHGRTRFFWAGAQLLREEFRSAGRTSYREYLWHPELALLLGIWHDGRLYSVCSDHRCAPLCAFDETGKLVWQAEYDPFGRATVVVEEIDIPWRLAGQYHDAESGLHYNFARYYDPRLGRYLSPDPLGTKGGCFNHYLYANGDPINQVDPLGEFPLPAILVAIGWGLGLGGLLGGSAGGGLEAYQQVQTYGEVVDWPAIGWEAAKGGGKGAFAGGLSGGAGAWIGPMLGSGAGITGAAATNAVESVVESCSLRALDGEICAITETATGALRDATIGALTFGVGDNIARRALRGAPPPVDEFVDSAKKFLVDDLGGAENLLLPKLDALEKVDDLLLGSGSSLGASSLPRKLSNFDLPAPTVTPTGFGPYRATWGNDPKAFAMFEQQPGGGVEFTDIFRGGMPRGSAGRMAADAMRAVNISKPSAIRFVSIINQPTLDALNQGVAVGETALGRTLSNAVGELGGKVSRWETGTYRAKVWIEGIAEY